MKKLYFISVVTLIMLMGNSFNTIAQAPEGFTYQAEARDGSGKLLTNKASTVKTTILKGSATDGIDVWNKNYNVTTDKYGLFSIVVGDAGNETSFSKIEWGTGKYFLNVQIKYGNTWINTGTTQLLSVPYALYAKSAGSANITETDPIFTGSQAFNITEGDITKLNNLSGTNTGDQDLRGKVDKVEGKGLSTNDYTSDEQLKLSGIANGAEVNVNADWDATEGDAQILHKPTLSSVSSSGSYIDLSDKPDFSIYATKNMAAQNITNLANPVNAEDAATKAYVDALKQQIKIFEDNLIAAGTYKLQDVEGNQYNVVKIGAQTWMAENLKTTKYRDGAAIPNVTDNTAWAGLTSGAYCWYDNDTGNKNTYGALYNWNAVNTEKLCPAGWHVPSDAEWTTLSTYLGGESVVGGKMKETGTTHWLAPNTGATNESGFSGLPGGCRIYDDTFTLLWDTGLWWSSTEYSASSAWLRSLNYYGSSIGRYGSLKGHGFSVRCVRDN